MKQPAEDTGAAAIEYEPALIEESVRRAIERGASGVEPMRLQRLRFDQRRRLDTLYALPQGERREALFREHFSTAFAELGIASWIPRWLEPFPRLRSELACVLVRAAARPGEEGADLWESRQQQGEGIPSYLVITIPSGGLRDHDAMRAALLPDLMRAADVVDPRFGFCAADLKADTQGAEEGLRAGYQRLWDLSARTRLRERGLRDDCRLLADARELVRGAEQRRLTATEVACSEAEELLDALRLDVSHRRILSLTRVLRSIVRAGASNAGARCPLCHYPTTDWAPSAALDAVESEIRVDFPEWSPSEACCAHCAERYTLLLRAHGK